MKILGIIVFLIALITTFLIIKLFQLAKGKKRVNQELNQIKTSKLDQFGSVKELSILPLIDYYSKSEDLKTESGVSYLIKADDIRVLMDVGFNRKKEHPSPLLNNLKALGVGCKDINMIFLSHLHMDHVGGFDEQKDGMFSLSQGKVDISKIPVYAPDQVVPSKWNSDLEVKIIKHPRQIHNGIASLGAIPRYLFIMGYTLEHSLAVNVEGKGIVLIIGCGHQTIGEIIKRTKSLFDEPIYGIIGGLHFPVNGGRSMFGPLNIQRLVGSDNPPWSGLNENDVMEAIDLIKKENPQIVALSPHDSSDWSIKMFKDAFKDKYRDIKVGEELVI